MLKEKNTYSIFSVKEAYKIIMITYILFGNTTKGTCKNSWRKKEEDLNEYKRLIKKKYVHELASKEKIRDLMIFLR